MFNTNIYAFQRWNGSRPRRVKSESQSYPRRSATATIGWLPKHQSINVSINIMTSSLVKDSRQCVKAAETHIPTIEIGSQHWPLSPPVLGFPFPPVRTPCTLILWLRLHIPCQMFEHITTSIIYQGSR